MRCKVGGEVQVPATCMEQIHIIRAADKISAYEKALRLGRSEQHSYLNCEGATVSWEFLGLENLEGLLGGVIRDGTEIRSRYLRVDNCDTLVRTKDELTIFKEEELAQKTALDILSEDVPGENSGADECGSTALD